MPTEPRLLREVLAAARGERYKPGYVSRQELSNRTHTLGHNVPVATIVMYEKKAGMIPPARALEVMAEALGLRPEDFYEYPIAKARADEVDAVKVRLAGKSRTRARRESQRPTDTR